MYKGKSNNKYIINKINNKIKDYIKLKNISRNNIELEYKIKCDASIFLLILNNLSKIIIPTSSKTINYISDNLVKQTDYINNTTKYYTKIKIVKLILQDYNNNISMSLSDENIININNDINNYNIIRIRNRLSFNIHIWRFDLTQVITTHDINNIDYYKEELFINNKQDLLQEYISKCNNNNITSLEIEVELVSKDYSSYICDMSFMTYMDGIIPDM